MVINNIENVFTAIFSCLKFDNLNLLFDSPHCWHKIFLKTFCRPKSVPAYIITAACELSL